MYRARAVKVFLDVGAHEGSSLHAVRDPKYGFERIYCFEPAPACWPALDAVPDDRVTVCRFGLWNRTCEHALYDPGSRGASLFEDKFKSIPGTERARFLRATDWFREHLGAADEIYVKLNCEGAECDIVEDLLDSGELATRALGDDRPRRPQDPFARTPRAATAGPPDSERTDQLSDGGGRDGRRHTPCTSPELASRRGSRDDVLRRTHSAGRVCHWRGPAWKARAPAGRTAATLWLASRNSSRSKIRQPSSPMATATLVTAPPTDLTPSSA
jgi:FkbM family methyltransferase